MLGGTVRSAMEDMRAETSAFGTKVIEMVRDAEEIKNEALQKYAVELRRRQQLLNEVHHLRGNIRVYCRVRPMLESDKKHPDAVVAIKCPSTTEITVEGKARDNKLGARSSRRGGQGKNLKSFEFDRVFGPRSTQKDVFEEVRPLVESVIDGFHGVIMAYGQTGSGKTYTMTGVESNRGLNHRALGELFGLIKHRADDDAVYTVQLSNVEIYNEELRDLFAESSEQKSLQIRQSRSKEGGVFVEGLTKTRVGTIEEAWGAIQKGEKRRSQAHTSMNIESSRSHSIVMLEVEGANPTSGRTTRGRLVLIDLAGSERVSKTEATGQQLREAQHINKSLSCLGDVISALESKAAHVPFRNSKLTHLLSSSLSKDNKAVLMVQVSPTLFNASESTCSLLFAQRAAKVELGKAQRHYSAAAKFAGVADRLKSMEAALKNADKKAKTLQKQHAAQIAKIREDTEAESNASDQKINAMEKEIKDMKKQLKHAKAVAASSEKATKEKSAASKSKLAADLERARSESEAKANDVKMLSKRTRKGRGMLRKSEADAKLYTDKIKELERKRRLSVGTSRAEAENEEEESEADLNAQLLKLQRDYKLLKRKAHAQRQKKSARQAADACGKENNRRQRSGTTQDKPSCWKSSCQQGDLARR